MTQWILLWAVAAVLFIAIDMIWLLWLGRGFYVNEIGGLLKQPPSLGAAAAFYLLYATGLLVLVIWPAHLQQSVSQALFYGLAIGIMAYGTYDLTNLSVMKGFTVRIALIDMAWGTFLTGSVSALTVWIGTLLKG